MALILHVLRRSSKEFLTTWIVLQDSNTILPSVTPPARLIILESALPVGPILLLDG